MTCHILGGLSLAEKSKVFAKKKSFSLQLFNTQTLVSSQRLREAQQPFAVRCLSDENLKYLISSDKNILQFERVRNSTRCDLKVIFCGKEGIGNEGKGCLPENLWFKNCTLKN